MSSGTASVLFSDVSRSTCLVSNKYSVMLSEASLVAQTVESACNAIWSREWKIWPLLVWTEGNPPTLFGLTLVQPLWKIVWRFLRKLKIELPYDPAVLLLGIYPDKTVIQKDICTSMFIAALFTIPKTSKCLLRLLIDNEGVVHIYSGLLLLSHFSHVWLCVTP